MGWGDMAKEAFAIAKEAVENGVRIKADVDHLGKALDRFENRMETRQAEHERSMKDENARLETRVRELERLLVSLTAKVDGAQSAALEVVLRDHLAGTAGGVPPTRQGPQAVDGAPQDSTTRRISGGDA